MKGSRLGVAFAISADSQGVLMIVGRHPPDGRWLEGGHLGAGPCGEVVEGRKWDASFGLSLQTLYS